MRNLRLLVSLCLAIVAGAAGAAEVPRLALTLADAENRALAESHRLQAADYTERAANARALAVSAQLTPNLSLEGGYRYLTEIPQLTLGPITRALGANNNYSIGPTLTYLLYDAGSLRKSTLGAEKSASASNAEKRATENEVRLALRSAYFGVQNAIERMRLVVDSLRLAEARHSDIRRRATAGAASRSDLLSAHTDVLDFELKLRQAQADLAASLADMLALIGTKDSFSLDRPVDASFAAEKHAALAEPTLIVQLDPLAGTLDNFARLVDKVSGPHSPRLEALSDRAASSRLAAESQDATRAPKLQLYARSSLDYPNGPVIQQINQNTFGLNLSMPIFDGGRAKALAGESRAQAQSFDEQREQLRSDLQRDWDKVSARLASLTSQQALARGGAEEAGKIAELMFMSYRAGRVRYLEVQNANLRALEWNVNRALIETQILLQLAVQASLSRDPL